jgi:hypothetical protein
MQTHALNVRPRARQAGILLLTVALVALAACKKPAPPSPPSSDIVVQAHFAYQDSNQVRNIVDSRVEVWRYAPRPPAGWGWGKDRYGYTDDAGKFATRLPFGQPGIVYAVRVFAQNNAALCCVGDLEHVFAQPPSTNGQTEVKVQNAGTTVVWDHTFTDPVWNSAFNIVETIRHAKYYFEQHRDPGEAASQPQHIAHVALGGCSAFSPKASCMWPVSGDIKIYPPDSFDDYLIVHEYAHYLQYDVGSLAWIASDHSGCTPGSLHVLTEGNPAKIETYKEQLAWMEGFADWYSWLLKDKIGSLPNVNFAGSAGQDNLAETNNCPESAPPDSVPGQKLERHVGNMLMDLTDTTNETGDRAGGLEGMILQIMDQELGTPTTRSWPTTWGFYSAASQRYFNVGKTQDLADIYDLNRIDHPALI